ncbi:MAG: hypothetical protein IAE99_01465 [Rhodothermales bacterium]|nr:hypothetical protein [Rhodothermales bacterium]
MLNELHRVFGTMEFEDNGMLRVTGFECQGAEATLRFDLHTGVEQEPPQPWRVDCHGLEGFAFSSSLAYNLDVTDDDPALWPHTQPSAKLYCSVVTPDKADALLGALYRAHVEAVGEADEAIPFGRGLNAVNAFDGGLGLVAEGPLSLLRAYQRSLEVHGVRTSVIGEQPPHRWDGQQWIRMPAGLQLLVFGDNWIVAESFEIARAV